jgi:hypothetical protein
MQLNTCDLFLNASTPRLDSRLKVLIIYEDVPAGKKAKEICDLLTQLLGEPWQMDLDLLNFATLRRVESVAASFDQDLVIVSCGNGKLPKSVRNWIDTFAAHPGFSGALAALIAVSPWERDGRRTTQSYLAAAARRRGMKFFSTTYIVEAQ